MRFRRERGIKLWARNGRNWAGDIESVSLDVEAVCLLEDGRPDFHALRSRHACGDARLIAYDLLALDGEYVSRLPLHERRRRLADLLAGNYVARFSDHVGGRKGAALLRRACAMGLEGNVETDRYAYRSGPFLEWRSGRARRT